MLINSFKNSNEKFLFDLKLFFFVGCWCLFWLSINSKPSQLTGNGLDIINGIRSILPGILILPLSYFCLKKFLNNDFNFKKVDIIDIVFFLLSIYLICKILGGLHLFGKKNYLEFNYLTFSFLSMVLVCQNYIGYKNNKNFIIIISIVSLFFLFALTIFYISVSFKVYFLDPNQIFSKWMYAIHPITNEVFKSPYPRITGMSRIIAVLSIIIFIFFLISKKKYIKIFLFLIFNFFSIVIWMMQSRGTLICFISTIFILILFDANLKKYKKFILILLLILTPYASVELITNFKFNYNVNKFYEKCVVQTKIKAQKEKICTSGGNSFAINYEFLEKFLKLADETNEKVILEDKPNSDNNNKIETLSNNSIIEYPGNEFRLIKPHNHETAGYTSGRIAIWKKIFDLYDFKKFFGLGAQGDRQILMGEESKFILSSNASNLLIYSFISAGYLGLLSMITICLILVFKILHFFYRNKKLIYRDNLLNLTGASLLIFLLIRSLVENSFGLFSIDAILFINGLMLLFTKLKFSIKDSH